MNGGLFSVGIIVLVLGIFSFSYSYFIADNSANPAGLDKLQTYAVPSMIVGLFIMVLGSLMEKNTVKSENSEFDDELDLSLYPEETKTSSTTVIKK